MRNEDKEKEQLIKEIKNLREQVERLKMAQVSSSEMAEQFLKQRRMLKGLARAKYCLLTETDYQKAISSALEILGETTDADWVSISINEPWLGEGRIKFNWSYRWARAPYEHNGADVGQTFYARMGIDDWYKVLASGQAMAVSISGENEDERRFLAQYGAMSVLVLPILIGNKLSGIISFQNCARERIWIENEKSMLSGIASCIGGVLQHRQVEKELMKNEERFRLLIENSMDIIVIFNDKGDIIYATPSIEKIIGISHETAVHGNIFSSIHPDDSPVIRKGIEAMLREPGAISHYECRVKHNDGRWHIVEGTIRNLMHEPCVGGLVVNSRDITLRKNAEQALSSEKERLSITLNSLGEGVITTDSQDRVTLINRAAEELTGWNQEEAYLKPIEEVFHIIDEKSRLAYASPIKKVLSPRGLYGVNRHTILVSKDGKERIIADSGALIRDRNDDAVGTVLVFRDITDKLSMEDELFRASKIESVGILAGGIAHDFNNILTIILGNNSLAKMYAEAGNKEKLVDRLEDVESAGKQARDLTQQLLTFARGGMPVVKVASIGKLLKDNSGLASRGSNVWCQVNVPEGLWPVEVDEGQIGQAINNLVINAIQAMPNGGALKISAENYIAQGGNTLLMGPGKYIKICFSDSGIGIPKDHISKIFDPYFTTKPNGLGLGLAATYSIVKKHGGYITVNSIQGEGTEFTVFIPAYMGQAPKVKEEGLKSITGSGRVLVMDDEDGVRNVVGLMLEGLGYEVSFAADGIAAVVLYNKALESGQKFDVVLMDLTIPGGMGGKEAIGKLLEIDPEVKAIVSSGYSNDPVMSEFKKYGFKGVVAKPYRVEELSMAIHRIMTGADV